MFRLLITVKDYQARFQEAYRHLSTNGASITFCPELDQLTAAEKAAVLANQDALHVAAEQWNADVLAMAPQVRIISRMGSGTDNIDLKYCKEHHIAVTNSKGCNATAVAEMTLLLTLASLRGLHQLYGIAQSGHWEKRCAGKELRGKTVGLLGFGEIARRVAELLQPFGVRIISHDPFMDHSRAAALGVEPTAFPELLAGADILSVHIPALKENIGMFNRETFASMKDGAVFINCARGALVNEDDLFEALQSGKLYAAASDVFAQEPLPAGNKLFTLPNFIGTPHEAGMTLESACADSMTIAQSIADFMRGESPANRVV